MVQNSIADAICKRFNQAPATVVYESSNLSEYLSARQFGERKHCFPKNIWLEENRIKRIVTTSAPIGCSYESFVCGAAVRNGVADTKKDVDYESGKSWHVRSAEYGKLFECHKNDATKLYLRVQYTDSQKAAGLAVDKVAWVITLGDKEITLSEKDAKEYTEEVDGICYRLGDYIKAKKANKATAPQLAAGVSEENKINYTCVSLDNIISIEQGTEKWVR